MNPGQQVKEFLSKQHAAVTIAAVADALDLPPKRAEHFLDCLVEDGEAVAAELLMKKFPHNREYRIVGNLRAHVATTFSGPITPADTRAAEAAPKIGMALARAEKHDTMMAAGPIVVRGAVADAAELHALRGTKRAILRVLVEEKLPITGAEVAQRIGLHYSGVLNHLNHLVSMGFVQKTARAATGDNTWKPGSYSATVGLEFFAGDDPPANDPSVSHDTPRKNPSGAGGGASVNMAGAATSETRTMNRFNGDASHDKAPTVPCDESVWPLLQGHLSREELRGFCRGNILLLSMRGGPEDLQRIPLFSSLLSEVV